MKFTLDKKILAGFIACCLLLLIVAVISFRNSEKFLATNYWVNHTHQVLYEMEQVLQYSVDAETGERGYIITGEPVYLEPFNNAKSKMKEHMAKALEMTADNPTQQKNLKELSVKVDDHVSYLENSIDLRKKKGFSEAEKLLAEGEGKRKLDEIRNRVADAKSIENTLLLEREKTSQQDAQGFTIVFIVLLLVIAIVLITVYFIINANLKALRVAELESENKNWNLTGSGELTLNMQGNKTAAQLSQIIITYLCKYLNAQIGAIYLIEEDEAHLKLEAGHALDKRKWESNVIRIGEGIVGQSAAEGKIVMLNDIPKEYFNLHSGFGEIVPHHIIAAPFIFEDKVLGVVEIGSITGFSKLQKDFLPIVLSNIAIGIASAQAREKMRILLEETQRQSEELQTQQEELRQLNEELEEQSQNLKQQQEELQMTNEELEEQTQNLEAKNKEVEAASLDIEQKTRQLEISSRYKSEFLANMSHELRTPLNSLLILSKDLADNKSKNLTAVQVESAEIINKSGMDLLGLINEVLDLSKIEAGKMTLDLERLDLKEFVKDLNRDFKHQTENKGLKLNMTIEPGVPDAIRTDAKRLDQIVKNLMSNAIKFTSKGSISVIIQKSDEEHIAISVKDTGIGVAPDKQMAIFEAFHQGDGSTSRKYGGTGLGLSISRELSRLLGGQIKLTSKVGEGSTFTLIVPVEIKEENAMNLSHVRQEGLGRPVPVFEKQSNLYGHPTIADDRDSISEGDKIVLVIEDDLKFANILLKQAHTKGFKCLSASTGEDGLALAEQYKPNAIILDIDLPGIDGHQVLAELKSNPSTRHIPVHIMSVDERSMSPIKEGAIEYLTKPINKNDLEEAFNRIENFIERKMRNLLIVEDDDNSRKVIKLLIGNGDVKTFEAGSGAEALAAYEANRIDCIVLDLGLPDMSGFELIKQLEKVKDGTMPPIIIYTGKELSKAENDELQKYAETIIIKGVKSEERLLDETALFLHRTISSMPAAKQKIIAGLYDRESTFVNKRILLVDDDMRNVFALSKVLKERGMEISKAENGLIALDILNKQPSFDLVLMDIMMPEMDGYETMRNIRAQIQFSKLPIIALTAKAMKDDKQKCIDAGANDYITKPVDVERLLSLMRVWLSK
ncbi:MAG: histidine kinase [Bacteroidetes bacterium]|nr:histidine kinase [Bacteroidota bacterium]